MTLPCVLKAAYDTRAAILHPPRVEAPPPGNSEFKRKPGTQAESFLIGSETGRSTRSAES